jgi:hypothetical protein
MNKEDFRENFKAFCPLGAKKMEGQGFEGFA